MTSFATFRSQIAHVRSYVAAIVVVITLETNLMLTVISDQRLQAQGNCFPRNTPKTSKLCSLVGRNAVSPEAENSKNEEGSATPSSPRRHVFDHNV